jgi:hypothetical protein
VQKEACLRSKLANFKLIVKHVLLKSKSIIIQACFIILITFILSEITLRIYNYFEPTFIFYDNSYNRYRGKPHERDYDNFRLNSLGFKDKEFTKKKMGTFRIIGIGDSFAFGVVPYKNNYLTLLGSQLRHDGYNIELLNLGIPGIGPKEYLELFVREGLALKPDMVLLTFFVGNDFTDCLEKKKYYEYSYVAVFIKYLITLETKFKKIDINGGGHYYDDKPTMKKDIYFNVERKRSLIYLKGNHTLQRTAKLVFYYLSKINSICKHERIKFIVVVAPDEIQINDTLRQEVIKDYYSKSRNKWDNTLPIAVLTGGLSKLGITYINLYPYFKEKSGERLYKPQDSHWNIAGNKLAAGIMQKNIAKLLNKSASKSQPVLCGKNRFK